MKEFWEFLRGVFFHFFYRLEETDYLRFPVYNEFLIKTWVGKFPFLGTKKTVERSIGKDKAVFQSEVAALLKNGIKVRISYLSLRGFDQVVAEYPELTQDEWIQLRLAAIDSGAARR